jgi:hypothetical protein
MKLLICTVAFCIAGGAFAQQQFPASLNLAVKESKAVVQDTLKLNPHLSYYSKNYDKVFPTAHYTFDSMEYGSNVIHIGDRNGGFYDRDTPHIFRVMPMAGVNVDAWSANPCNSGYTIEPKK